MGRGQGGVSERRLERMDRVPPSSTLRPHEVFFVVLFYFLRLWHVFSGRGDGSYLAPRMRVRAPISSINAEQRPRDDSSQ